MKGKKKFRRRRPCRLSLVMSWTAGTAFLGILLIFASIPLVTKPVQRAPAAASSDASGVPINVSASLGDDGMLTVFIGLPVDRADIIDPQVEVVMPAHQMSVRANVLSAGPRAFQARAKLPMAGQWEVRVSIGRDWIKLPVEATEVEM